MFYEFQPDVILVILSLRRSPLRTLQNKAIIHKPTSMETINSNQQHMCMYMQQYARVTFPGI